MHKYKMIVSRSRDSNRYIVDVPELPGCMADGKTAVEAIKNAEKIIAEWIETARELGRKIPN